jgi:hypothetical protein
MRNKKSRTLEEVRHESGLTPTAKTVLCSQTQDGFGFAKLYISLLTQKIFLKECEFSVKSLYQQNLFFNQLNAIHPTLI